jgi:hypothetical protein
MVESPQRVRRVQKDPVLVSGRIQTTLYFTMRVAASRHISMALARSKKVEGKVILVFGRVVTKCRLAFALCATLTLPSELQRIGSVRSDSSTPGNAISRLCRSGR